MELLIADAQTMLTVSEGIFGHEFNEALVHQVVVAYAAAARQGTSAQKTRGEVTASGKKPWKQKGTGRARAGSVASPLWRSGGVTFAAKPRSYEQKVNRKMYRGAMRSIFSELLRQQRLIVMDAFTVEAPKTKLLAQKLETMAIKNLLIVTTDFDENLYRSAQNLRNIQVCDVESLDPVSLIRFDKVLMTTDAVKQVEEWLA